MEAYLGLYAAEAVEIVAAVDDAAAAVGIVAEIAEAKQKLEYRLMLRKAIEMVGLSFRVELAVSRGLHLIVILWMLILLLLVFVSLKSTT